MLWQARRAAEPAYSGFFGDVVPQQTHRSPFGDGPPTEDLDDQIRGVAMALRHWFLIEDVETVQRRAGLIPPKSARPTRDYDKSLRVLTLSALPPQLVRLKPDSPIVTLHFMQDVYDDGSLRADPWRWWFAWIAVELIARTGPDPQGLKTARFVREDPSLETVRAVAPRWLAANPQRMAFVESRRRRVLEAVLDESRPAGASGGRDLQERVLATAGHLHLDLVEAMTDEAGRVAAAISLRLRERAERIR